MSKPFLLIQLRPEDITADNEMLKIKHYGGLADSELKRIRVEQNGLPGIAVNDFSGIIVGGSPFDVSTPESDKSAIQKKIEVGFNRLFDQLLERDFPFLGCCSGNGLLGNYLGTSVSRKYGEPVGGTDITLTAAGKDDPLLAGLPTTLRVLTGHKEACDNLPPGAVLLATNSSCPVQMFRVKSNIYATQFHPEGDAEGFTVRINTYRDHGYFPPASASQLIDTVSIEHTPDAHAILGNFVMRFRQH